MQNIIYIYIYMLYVYMFNYGRPVVDVLLLDSDKFLKIIGLAKLNYC